MDERDYKAMNKELNPPLQQCSVSGALPLAEIFDMLNKAHEELAKCSLSQDEYSPISWALVDAKKRLSVLLRQ